MTKFIDTHAHYLHRLFNKDREELIQHLLENHVEAIVECGTNTFHNARAIEYCEGHENIYATIGYFPTDTEELEKDPELIKTLERQLQHEKVLGLGEIGLDYHHPGNPKTQKKWFIEQLKLAKKLNMPVCIHSREAEKDTLDILKNNGQWKGVIHCYAYGKKTMEELVKLGYYFGVGGTCTYSNNKELREAVKYMPLDRIVLETDCPYLTPSAYGRKRNDSSKISAVISEIAKMKGITEEEVIRQTNENARKVYAKMR